MGFILISLIVLIGFTSYFLGSLRAKKLRTSKQKNLTSLNHYYGYYVALWAVVPALLILLMITSFKSFFIEQYVLSDFIALGSYTETELSLLFTQIQNTALGIKLFDENTILIDDAVNKLNYINKTIENLTYVTVLGLSGLLVLYSLININYKLNSRKIVEKFLLVLYFTCSLVAIMTTVGIIFSLLYETLRFFSQVPITDFLFGLNWSPQRVFVRDAGDLDTRDLANAFGAVPLFAGTFLVALIAMCVSVPVGLLTAIYMSEYASPKVRDWAKPIIEILAGIPTVVYGFFAALTVAPLVRDIGQGAGLTVSSESALLEINL